MQCGPGQGGDPTGSGTGGQSIYGGHFRDECDNRLLHSGEPRGDVHCIQAALSTAQIPHPAPPVWQGHHLHSLAARCALTQLTVVLPAEASDPAPRSHRPTALALSPSQGGACSPWPTAGRTPMAASSTSCTSPRTTWTTSTPCLGGWWAACRLSPQWSGSPSTRTTGPRRRVRRLQHGSSIYRPLYVLCNAVQSVCPRLNHA